MSNVQAQKTCFVIMSFDQLSKTVYDYPTSQVVRELGYECSRADSRTKLEDVPDRILTEIVSADLIVADLSEPKPNVYFELGIALAINKPTVCISRTEDLPFDFRNYRVLLYDIDQPDVLQVRLRERIQNLRTHEPNPVSVQTESKFAENLAAIVRERNRVSEFAGFVKAGWSDNTAVADRLIDLIQSRTGPDWNKKIIAISGAGSIGKSTFAKLVRARLVDRAGGRLIQILPTDAYMLTRSQRAAMNITGFNIASHDLKQFEMDLQRLRGGESVKIAPYDHSTGERGSEVVIDSPAVLILEGIFSFFPSINYILDFRTFLYTTGPAVKELKFLADSQNRGYTPMEAFRHSEREFEDYSAHVMPFL